MAQDFADDYPNHSFFETYGMKQQLGYFFNDFAL
jgi:hypothetical protein